MSRSAPSHAITPPPARPFAMLRGWACAIGIVMAWYVAAQAGIAFAIGVSPGQGAWLRDLAAHLLAGTALFMMARSLKRFALAMVVLFSAFTVSNAIKLAVLGGPVMPDDFIAVRNLFLLLEGWQLWGSVAMLALPLAGLLWMFAWRRRGHGWRWPAWCWR